MEAWIGPTSRCPRAGCSITELSLQRRLEYVETAAAPGLRPCVRIVGDSEAG